MQEKSIDCPECGAKISVDSYLERLATDQVAKKTMKKQKELKKREDILYDKESDFEDKLKEATKKEIEILREEEKEKLNTELLDLKNQVKEKDCDLQESQKNQLEMAKKIRDIEKKEKNMDLEIETRAQGIAKKETQENVEIISQQHNLSMMQRNIKEQQLKNKVEELQRKLAEGSQQVQGEVVEQDFENNLKLKFPTDQFDEVPKGISGADLLQTVRDSSLRKCGLIIWEFKNVKNFSKEWIVKLREDKRKANADIAVLVSNVLPKDTQNIELRDEVHVVSYELAIPISAILREFLTKISKTALVNNNKGEKMEIMYRYLTSSTFEQKFKSIVNAYKEQKKQLEQEKRSLTRIWSKREKQLDIVIEAAASMFGDIEAIAGNEAPAIEEMSLPNNEVELLEETTIPDQT